MAAHRGDAGRRLASSLLPACDAAVLVGAALFTYLRLASGDLAGADLSRPISALPMPLPAALLFTVAVMGGLVTWRVEFGVLDDQDARTLVMYGIVLTPAVVLFTAILEVRWPGAMSLAPVLWCGAAGAALAATARSMVATKRLRAIDTLRLASVTIAVVMLAWSLGVSQAEQRFLDLDVMGACAAALSVAAATMLAATGRRTTAE